MRRGFFHSDWRKAGDRQEDTLRSLAVALTFAGETATPRAKAITDIGSRWLTRDAARSSHMSFENRL
jgi:hypothetical protein